MQEASPVQAGVPGECVPYLSTVMSNQATSKARALPQRPQHRHLISKDLALLSWELMFPGVQDRDACTESVRKVETRARIALAPVEDVDLSGFLQLRCGQMPTVSSLLRETELDSDR